MLILSRKINECIVIDGHIVVKILRIDRDTVKLGIQAPAELPVHRQEIFDAIQRGKQQSPQNAAGPGTAPKAPLAHITPAGGRNPGPDSAGGSNGIPAPK
jgi:carbon storage regulator